MRFPRQASKASRSPLSPLPANLPAAASDEQLVGTKQVAAMGTRRRSESIVDLETCSPAPAKFGPRAEATDGATAAAICRRNDGRAWRCKNAAAEGSTLCGHHLARYAACSSQGPAAASGAKGSRCRRAGGGNRADGSSTRKKKRTATKPQKYAEEKSTQDGEKATAMDPEIYNAASILYHYIAGFWSAESVEMNHAADATLGDEEEDCFGDADLAAVHSDEGFLASD